MQGRSLLAYLNFIPQLRKLGNKKLPEGVNKQTQSYIIYLKLPTYLKGRSQGVCAASSAGTEKVKKEACVPQRKNVGDFIGKN
jgi:hypothetical protein